MAYLFQKADILLPNRQVSYPLFSVVACDQFTSRPDYWERVKSATKAVPSSCHMICPECDLPHVSLEEVSKKIGQAMQKYLAEGVFVTHPDALVLVRRHQQDGSVREGLVGQVDLEAYDYHKGSTSPVRATEETVPSRLPARQQLRANAPLELPHLLILMDDEKQEIVESLSAKRESFERLYDFECMEEGGRLEGYLLPQKEADAALAAINGFADPEAFAARYGNLPGGVLALAVGDGNHSLAAAKQCYEDKKAQFGAQSPQAEACRYALAELENLHQPALQFEAIHRVLFEIDTKAFMADLQAAFAQNDPVLLEGDCLEAVTKEGKQAFVIYEGDQKQTVVLNNPPHLLAVGSLQNFLDQWVAAHPCEIDYIHGVDEVQRFAAKAGNLGFVLPDMPKNQLYPTVLTYGALPRKTFSMGHANEKRYYLEAKYIVPQE